MEQIIEEVKRNVVAFDLPFPEIWIEPGRSLVGDAGTTIYTIGSRKEVPNVRQYVAVDGGMSDNIRPALYEAKYEAVLANRMHEHCEEVVAIAGKCCESGDMLIWDLPLPKAQPGDYLAVFVPVLTVMQWQIITIAFRVQRSYLLKMVKQSLS